MKTTQSLEILLFHTNPQAMDVIGFCLESQIGATIKECTSVSEATEILKTDEIFNLVIAEGGAPGEALLKILGDSATPPPVILITNGARSSEIQYPKIFAVLPLNQVGEELIDPIVKNFTQQIVAPEQDDFCRIKADLLSKMSLLSGDIYIRLSDYKYVKLFKSGTILNQEDKLKIINSKKVRNLYIKRTDCLEFIKILESDLESLMVQAEDGDSRLISQVMDVHELIHEFASKIGFSPEIQDLANQNVRFTVKAIGSRPKLKTILSESQFRGRGYISSHSILLANLACSIAAIIDLPSQTTFHKLVLAAFFHDFTFHDQRLAQYSTLSSLNEARETLGEERYQEVLNHPLKCAEIIRNLKETPGEVEFLVFQHHERPDGSGFPKGLKSHQIVALSAVFIVAHDLVDQLNALGPKFTMQAFLAAHEKIYDSGTFKKIWKALSDLV